ncbi:MAG TPA: glycosyltransferase [Puia sp.]|nr:glycosyltransferase [Puia sp.]
MTILVLGGFGNGAIENFYVKGFGHLPIDVETFDITKGYYEKLNKSLINKVVNKIEPAFFYTAINDQLLHFIQGKKYDVILLFKGLTIFPSTIRQLKEYTHLLCCYNPDHPFKFFSEGSGNANISESISLYDLHISYSENITKQLKEIYHIKACTIPFGFDDSPVDIPSLTQSQDTILFVGAYDHQRALFLKRLSEPTLCIYGDKKWYSRTYLDPALRDRYAGRSLYGDEYKSAVKESTGVLNLLRKQNILEGSHNMRTFEVPGYGGLLIANRTPEQQSFFQEDTEAVYFDSLEELKDRIGFLKKHDRLIDKIKAAGYQRSLRSGYSYTSRSEQLYVEIKKYL